MGDRVNLGELLQRGVPLFTREAAAVLHEVCSQLSQAEEEERALAPPAPEQLWVTAAGDLVMDAEPAAASGNAAQSTMAALADLIEALLPPAIRNQRDYAVPGSFRVLAPRARGFPPGLPLIRTPAELDAAIVRYRSGDTTLILQHLFERTAAEAPAPLAPAVATPVAQPQAETNPVIVPTADLSGEVVAAPPSPTIDPSGELDLPLNVQESETWVRPLPPSDTRSPSRGGPWMWLLAGAAAAVMAFAASYEVTRRMTQRSEMARRSEVAGRSEVTARASEPAVPAPERPEAEPARPAPSATPPRTSANPLVAGRAEPTPRVARDPRDAGDSPDAGDARNAGDARDARETLLAPPAPLLTPASTGPVFSPSFAGSGSALVFHAGRDPVARLMSADMSDPSSPLEVVTVVSDEARNYHPRLSPDGRLLAFDSDRDGERGVYIANRDGSHVRRVSGAGFAAVPSWSPDMRALAFVRAEPDRPRVWNLWLLDRTTGALTRLTRHRYGQTWGASWFPDSRRVSYSHEDRLIVLDTDDGSTTVFKSPRPGRLVRTPAVSPDGRLVAFQVLRDGVWLLDLDSGGMRRLIEDPSAEEFAWSPNGRRLAYHSRQSGEWRIWIAAAPSAVPDAH